MCFVPIGYAHKKSLCTILFGGGISCSKLMCVSFFSAVFVFVYAKLTSLFFSGYAHLSCLVKYASEKSRKVIHPDEGDFTEAWRECPNCNQSYVNELSAKMVNESVVFAEKNYPGSQWRLVLALLLKSAPARGDEAAKITHRIIGLIKEMK